MLKIEDGNIMFQDDDDGYRGNDKNQISTEQVVKTEETIANQ